jgi:hypothetical protein
MHPSISLHEPLVPSLVKAPTFCGGERILYALYQLICGEEQRSLGSAIERIVCARPLVVEFAKVQNSTQINTHRLL